MELLFSDIISLRSCYLFKFRQLLQEISQNEKKKRNNIQKGQILIENNKKQNKNIKSTLHNVLK